MRFRNFIFVIHAVEPEVFDDVLNRTIRCLDTALESKQVTYFVFQHERGARGDRDHIQGYCELSGQRTLNSVKELIGAPTAYIAKRLGPAKKAAEYCKKEESRVAGPWEGGEISSQGKRSDLQEVADIVLEGRPLREVARALPAKWILHSRGILALRDATSDPPLRHGPRVLFLHGPTGCGKSRSVREVLEGKAEYYVAADDPKVWFDGYWQQPVIFFDDFSGQAPLQTMLWLLDRGRLRLQVKGGYTHIHASWFVFTSNHSPGTFYTGGLGLVHQPAWLRRVEDEGTVINCRGLSFLEIKQRVSDFFQALFYELL